MSQDYKEECRSCGEERERTWTCPECHTTLCGKCLFETHEKVCPECGFHGYWSED